MDRKAYFYLVFIGAMLFATQECKAQSLGFEQDDNIKVSGITTSGQIGSLTPSQKQTTIIYFDGLGRPIQTIIEQASPLQKDIIQPVAYDNLGRPVTNYLPYTDQSNATSGSYRPNAISTDQPAFYNNPAQNLIPVDAAPYSQHVFENSPLQRVLQEGMVGTGFQPGVAGSHTKTAIYRFNNSGDGNILQWNVDGTYTTGTYYLNNTLSVTDSKDEDNTETLIFTDLAGHMVLKRQIKATTNYDTYYIYNNAGMLSYVIPPNATDLLSANSYDITTIPLSNMIFKFMYDNPRGRLVQKTVPAKGVIYIVYDPLNRPVLMQDANMRTGNKWNYIKYDAKGRAVSQGIYVDATHTSFSSMQTYVNSLSTTYTSIWYEARTATLTAGGYYTNNVFPTTGITSLAFAYFDDYLLKEGANPDFAYVSQGLTNEEQATTAPVKGMPTMVTQTTVGAGLTNTWLTKVTFYDKRLHSIQQLSNNHLYYNGYTTTAALTDSKTTVPDFTGMLQSAQVVKQTASATSIKVLSTLTYDQSYRLTSIRQQYNSGGSKVIAAYSYNELGQAVQKNLGQIAAGLIPQTLNLNTTYSGTNTQIAQSSISLSPGFSVPSGAIFNAFISTGYLQTEDMRYNIRGQLLSINNSKLSNDGGITNADNTDLFGMQINYDVVDGNIGNTASFDGKITAIKWMSKDANNINSFERSYSYSYDQLNRYTGSAYAERVSTSTGTFNNNMGGFNESGIMYNSGGNILALNRNASTQGTNSHTAIDALTYNYSSTNPNQLITVTDATGNAQGFNNYTGSSNAYTYDGTNGNLTVDPYKGMTMTYNVLNRTNSTTFTAATNRYINYTYDAGGNLIRKQTYDNNMLQTTTDYLDGFVYLMQGTGTAILSYFPMPEGRVLNNTGTLAQEYIITDQQGNARLSFQDNGNGMPVVKQENSYYAFGLIMPNSPVAMPTTPNKRLYNGGSEWQNDFSNLPDYYQTFNRNYDAALGRFIGVDPVAESAESMTTYQYAGNNPVMFNDPNGDAGEQYDYLLHPYWNHKHHSSNDHGQNQQYLYNTNTNDDGYGGYGTLGNLMEAVSAGDAAAAQIYGQLYGTTIYSAEGASTSSHTQIAESSIASNIDYYTSYGLTDDIAGHTSLSEVLISDASWKIQKEAYETDYYKDANQDDRCGSCLVPESLNRFPQIEIYGGWNNPMSRDGQENYSLSPRNYTDVNTYHHDRDYDLFRGNGPTSVLLNTDVIPADMTLIVNSFDVAFSPSERVTLKDKAESLFVGSLFLIITTPKILVSLHLP